MIGKAGLAALLAATALAVQPMAQELPEGELPEGWEPAMLILQAESVLVASSSAGQTITLQNVHPVVSIVSELHTSRCFQAATIEDFAEHYNSCNDMKHALGLWHEDGSNALFTYAIGPDNGYAARYRQHMPLVTNPDVDDMTQVTGGPAGSVYLFIDEASYAAPAQSLTFDLFDHTPLADGLYEQVTLLAECFVGVM